MDGDVAVGGLVGSNREAVLNSYTTGNASGNGAIGGLVGDNVAGNVSESYAAGDINGSGDGVGGLIGSIFSGNISGSYWDVEKTGLSVSEGGTGLTTDEMAGTDAINNMTTFDFTTTWRTVMNPDDYPVLVWEKGGSGPSIDDYRDDPSDPTSAVSLSGLQGAIDDFVNNNISLSLLQDVINEFVAT